MINYKWPLNINNATWLDRLKLCKFLLNPKNRWTQDKYVTEFERKMAKYVGCEYAVFVSSGSSANAILSMYLRDITNGKEKNIIVLPATTWSTSCSPFIREGFDPYFIDIKFDDLSMDLDKLEELLVKNSDKIVCIFITSLLGFAPNIDRLFELSTKYKVKIMMDNCESTLTDYTQNIGWDNWTFNISNVFTSTTSTYFGHCLNTNEGGFIFTNNQNEYEYFLMIRNHGMTRSLLNTSFPLNNDGFINYSYIKYRNEKVDSRFDFYCLGSNFRNTELNAATGLLDFNRIEMYKKKRRYLYEIFSTNINHNRYILPFHKFGNTPFSLPIIVKGNDKDYRINAIKEYCKSHLIETRPVISGCLLAQTAFQKFGKPEDYPISDYIEKYGLYLGLYSKLKEKQIINLVDKLNKI